jgi:RNA polymerase sigma-70 factor (ECF subfamily)
MISEGVEDIVLVKKAQGGNQSAYEGLIRRYARLIWASIYGIIEDPAWTEDLVQETFFKAWQSIRTLQEPAKFRGWLIMIARREALQYTRKSSRQEQIIENIASCSDAESPAQAISGGADADAEDLRQQLHSVLRQMPERYRLPLTLRYLEEFDYNKIAGLLGLTDGSLRGLLNRGMKMLRQTVNIKMKED